MKFKNEIRLTENQVLLLQPFEDMVRKANKNGETPMIIAQLFPVGVDDEGIPIMKIGFISEKKGLALNAALEPFK